jgi:ubiquinone/menaquinone biosynthesis C-methylase UbiE
VNLAKGLMQWWSSRTGPLPLPPEILIQGVGGGNYEAVGKEFFRHLVQLCGLRPADRVLDIGCGCGRIAVPLTEYLNEQGSYEGFDIVPEQIKWSKRTIERRYPRFRFHLVDVFNKTYNPKGKYTANEYKFPFEDRSFDVVFLTSVFTHMLTADLQQYLSEIVRVLKPGGRTLITYFLLNEESRRLLDAGKGSLAFKYDVGGCLSTNREAPEAAVAYEESFVRSLYQKYGLKITEPIRYGMWCERAEFLSYQDIVVAARPG